MTGLHPKRGIAIALVLASLCMTGSLAFAQGGKGQRQLSRAQLPAGFAIGSGSPVLALQVEVADGRVASASPATGGGNLRATRSGSEAEPMLTVKSDLPVAIKFDLYLSQDGERFTYTSSCALTPGISSFEMWQQPVREFAIGNPRVVDRKRISCD